MFPVCFASLVPSKVVCDGMTISLFQGLALLRDSKRLEAEGLRIMDEAAEKRAQGIEQVYAATLATPAALGC